MCALLARGGGGAERPRDRSRSRMWIGLSLIVAVQIGICVYFARYALIDDAFIAFRYVENFLQGHGLVFNIGERVEGYTCFLWIVLLCVPTALGLDPAIASRILGAGLLTLTLIVTSRFLPADPERPAWSRLIAPALLAVNAASALWAVHGLETAMFTFLLTAALRADVRDHGGTEFVAGWSALWYALAALTRPEGTLIFGASFLFWAVTGPRRLASLPIWRHALLFSAVLVPHELWRYHYYGELLPNTFYAKVGMSWPLVARGGIYVLRFFGSSGGFVFLAITPALVAVRRDRRIAFLVWILTLFLMLVVLEGGDAFPAWRFLVPIFPVLYLLVQEGIHALIARAGAVSAGWRTDGSRDTRPAIGRSGEPGRRARGTPPAIASSLERGSRVRAVQPSARRAPLVWGVAALFFAAVALHTWLTFQEALKEARGAETFTRDMTLAGLCLGRHLPVTARIALNPAGAVPYYSRLYAYDMLGLTDRHIARSPVAQMGTGRAGHEKGDGAYILDQRPEVILFGNVQIAPAGPVDLRSVHLKAALRSENEIARDPRTTKMYIPDQLPLGDGRYLLFLRRTDFALVAR